MFVYFVRNPQFKININTGGGCITTLTNKEGKLKNTARARNGATNVEHLVISNLDCLSMKDER